MDNLDTSDLQKAALKSLSNDIEKIENAFATALRNTASVAKERTEIKTSKEVKTEADEKVPTVRHSISEIVGKEKNYGIGVVLDTNIFDGIKPRYWNKVLSDFVYKNFAGKEIAVYDENGNLEYISFAEINERVTKDGSNTSHKVIDKLARPGGNIQKLSVVHIDELLETSKKISGNTDNNHQWLDANGWEYRTTYVQDIKGGIYEATLNIANSRDGRKVLYSVSNVKKVDEGVVSSMSNDKGTRSLSVNSNNSIRQESKNVNTQNNVKHSISHTRKGEPVVVVDTNILKGVDESLWKEKVKEAIKGFYPGLLFKGGEAEVKKKTYDEYLKSRYTNSIRKFEKDVYEDKLRASNHLDEILLSVTDTRTEELFHDRADKIKGFVHGDVKIVVGDNKYMADAVVGIKEDGSMLVYDVVDFMPAEFELEEQNEKAGVRSSRSITKETSEKERAEILMKTKISVIHMTDAIKNRIKKLDGEFSEEYFNNHYNSKKGMAKFCRDTGIVGKDKPNTYKCAALGIDVDFSASSVEESYEKQGNDKNILANALLRLPELLDKAVLIKASNDRYEMVIYPQHDIETMSVLVAAFENDMGDIIPVKLEIKEYVSGNTPSSLYVVVTVENKKRNTVISDPTVRNAKRQTSSSVSKISIAEYLGFVNSEKSGIIKYFPDEVLSQEQLEIKQKELKEESEYIKKKELDMWDRRDGK